MVGTIMSNFWIALLTFSILFLFSYPFIEGAIILIPIILWAILSFFITFGGRAILSYVLDDRMKKIEVEVPFTQDSSQTTVVGSKEYAEIIKDMINEES